MKKTSPSAAVRHWGGMVAYHQDDSYMQRVTVTLDRRTLTYARRLGQGNVSRGIREVFNRVQHQDEVRRELAETVLIL